MDEEMFSDDDELMDESGEDVMLLLLSMQKQLVTLEKKVDMLLQQSRGKSHSDTSFRDRPFRKGPYAKPGHSYDRPNRYGRDDRERSPREKDSSRGHYMERRKSDKPKSGKPGKKPFYAPYKDRE